MDSNFNESFGKLMISEGGYVNDKDDSGGETYLGITRRDHPNAKMWKIIDNIKNIEKPKDMTARLKVIPDILNEARGIYKKQYWDPIHLDEIDNKPLAHQIFDHAVNAGVGSAIGLAQELVGIPVTKKYSKLLIDKLKAYGSV